MSEVDEALAAAIFRQAIKEERAAELLQCLFGGGSATLQAGTGELVLVDAGAMQALFGTGEEEPGGSER